MSKSGSIKVKVEPKEPKVKKEKVETPEKKETDDTLLHETLGHIYFDKLPNTRPGKFGTPVYLGWDMHTNELHRRSRLAPEEQYFLNVLQSVCDLKSSYAYMDMVHGLTFVPLLAKGKSSYGFQFVCGAGATRGFLVAFTSTKVIGEEAALQLVRRQGFHEELKFFSLISTRARVEEDRFLIFKGELGEKNWFFLEDYIISSSASTDVPTPTAETSNMMDEEEE